MLYKERNSTLYPPYALDIRDLLLSFTSQPSLSFSIFKEKCKDRKFSLIFFAKPDDVDKKLFIDELYSVCLGYLLLGPVYHTLQLRIGCLYLLYYFYQVQKNRPRIKIDLTPECFKELHTLRLESKKHGIVDAYHILNILRNTGAYEYTAAVRIDPLASTIAPPKSSLSNPQLGINPGFGNSMAKNVDLHKGYDEIRNSLAGWGENLLKNSKQNMEIDDFPQEEEESDDSDEDITPEKQKQKEEREILKKRRKQQEIFSDFANVEKDYLALKQKLPPNSSSPSNQQQIPHLIDPKFSTSLSSNLFEQYSTSEDNQNEDEVETVEEPSELTTTSDPNQNPQILISSASQQLKKKRKEDRLKSFLQEVNTPSKKKTSSSASSVGSASTPKDLRMKSSPLLEKVKELIPGFDVEQEQLTRQHKKTKKKQKEEQKQKQKESEEEGAASAASSPINDAPAPSSSNKLPKDLSEILMNIVNNPVYYYGTNNNSGSATSSSAGENQLLRVRTAGVGYNINESANGTGRGMIFVKPDPTMMNNNDYSITAPGIQFPMVFSPNTENEDEDEDENQLTNSGGFGIPSAQAPEIKDINNDPMAD